MTWLRTSTPRCLTPSQATRFGLGSGFSSPSGQLLSCPRLFYAALRGIVVFGSDPVELAI